MTDTDLIFTIKKTLSEVISNDEILNLAETSSLKDDIGLDSMTSLTFLMALEHKLDFTVDPSTLRAADFDSIQSLCAYVRTQKSRSVPAQAIS